MTVTVVAHTAKAAVPGTNGSTTVAIDTSTATLIVIGVTENSSIPAVVSDSKGNTWVALTRQASSNGASRQYYCLTPIVGTGHTFSATAGGCSAAISVIALSGAAVSSTFVQENGIFTNGSPSSQSRGLSSSASDGAIVTCMNVDLAVTPTIDVGFTREDSVNTDGATVYGISHAFLNTSSAGVTPTWSWAGGAICSMCIALFTVKAPAAAVLRPNPPQLIG